MVSEIHQEDYGIGHTNDIKLYALIYNILSQIQCQ